MTNLMRIYENDNYVFFYDEETKQLKDYMLQPDETLDVVLKGYNIYKRLSVKNSKEKVIVIDDKDEVLFENDNILAIRDFIEDLKWKKKYGKKQ